MRSTWTQLPVSKLHQLLAGLGRLSSVSGSSVRLSDVESCQLQPPLASRDVKAQAFASF
jgi:hypothetical protein